MNKDQAESSLQSFQQRHLMVVGIGASAGGIKALKRFFSLMPTDSGMAFVVILHLLPHHESNLAAIFQTQTAMPVTQVCETVKVEPNHIYVIPPDKNLAMVDGHIELTEPQKSRGRRTAIDLFFRIPADAYGKNAVAVVLSGTGSEHGGFTLVQDPSEAEYDGMPLSAIATNLADLVLPVEEIPARFINLQQTAEEFDFDNDEKPPEISRKKTLREILTLLKICTGHDFANYKRPTLLRRVARRLQVHGLADIADYLVFLRENPEELNALLADLLISVTNFFRDKETFEALEREVVPKLFAGKTSADTIRVWVAAARRARKPIRWRLFCANTLRI